MALDTDLMGSSIPDKAAVLLGWPTVATVAATGSSASDAAVLLKSQTLVETTGSASTGLKLPADAPLNVPYVIANLDTNAKLIYPPTDGQINGDTASTGTVPLTSRGTSTLIRTAVNKWIAIGGAAG